MSLLRSDIDAFWQVIEVEDSKANIVHIDEEKVKFHRGNVIYSGDMATAITMVLCHKEKMKKAKGRKVASGDYSSAASSGNYSSAASSGYSSSAASSGDSSRAASSGDYSIAMVCGYDGQVKSGPNGCFAIAWHDGERPRIIVGYIGEDGIKADTWYEVKNGKLSEVKS